MTCLSGKNLVVISCIMPPAVTINNTLLEPADPNESDHIAMFGSEGAKPGQFYYPCYLSFYTDTVYIIDGNDRVSGFLVHVDNSSSVLVKESFILLME